MLFFTSTFIYLLIGFLVYSQCISRIKSWHTHAYCSNQKQLGNHPLPLFQLSNYPHTINSRVTCIFLKSTLKVALAYWTFSTCPALSSNEPQKRGPTAPLVPCLTLCQPPLEITACTCRVCESSRFSRTVQADGRAANATALINNPLRVNDFILCAFPDIFHINEVLLCVAMSVWVNGWIVFVSGASSCWETLQHLIT